jgi:hypothetical protein
VSRRPALRNWGIASDPEVSCSSCARRAMAPMTHGQWRVIALDSTMFVSAFGVETEGRLSPMYRLGSTAYGGALHRGLRRHIDEMRTTSRRVV